MSITEIKLRFMEIALMVLYRSLPKIINIEDYPKICSKILRLRRKIEDKIKEVE